MASAEAGWEEAARLSEPDLNPLHWGLGTPKRQKGTGAVSVANFDDMFDTVGLWVLNIGEN